MEIFFSFQSVIFVIADYFENNKDKQMSNTQITAQLHENLKKQSLEILDVYQTHLNLLEDIEIID